jgi:hypothetical protein
VSLHGLSGQTWSEWQTTLQLDLFQEHGDGLRSGHAKLRQYLFSIGF